MAETPDQPRKSAAERFAAMMPEVDTPLSSQRLTADTLRRLDQRGYRTLGDLRRLSISDINNVVWLKQLQKAELVAVRRMIPKKFPSELQQALDAAMKDAGKPQLKRTPKKKKSD